MPPRGWTTWRLEMKALPKLNRQQQARFESYIPLNPDPDECWEWESCITNAGYPSFGIGQDKFYAHRLMYCQHYGKDPGDLHVLHNCDNPKCMNPNHLFLGTDADNQADKQEKGRDFKSDDTYCSASLTSEQIVAIRESTDTNIDLANKYGMSDGSISLIKSGKTYVSVGGPIGVERVNQPKLNEEQVHEIRQSSDSLRSLASEYGVDRNVIKKIKNGSGYQWVPWLPNETRMSGKQVSGRKPTTTNEQVQEILTSDLNNAELSRKLGLNQDTIRLCRKRGGVKTKPRKIYSWTDEQVQELIYSKESHAALARKYGDISVTTLSIKRKALQAAHPPN